MKIVFILLCLNGLLTAPYKGIALLLDGGFKTGHLPLLAGGELLGIGLWERGRQLQWCLLCLSKQLLLFLKENSVYVADYDSVVLCDCWGASLEQENCLHRSSFDHHLAAAMEAPLRCVRSSRW
jgi:hypothetical protein